MKIFYNLKKLIRYADSVVNDYDIVSFDLFDTLFIRRIHDPDMVKPAVARFIVQKASIFGYHWNWEEVQLLRNKYENEQRAETGKKFEDHEACYPDYMHKVLSRIFKDKMTDDLLEEVTNHELKIEMAMIVPRADLVAWLKKIYSEEKKILIVSDIYLPAGHLKRLIDHVGLLKYVTDVVSSADTFLAKASGKAFPMLLEKYALKKEKWMHIGDNPFSDGLRPAEFGIQSFILKDISEKTRKTITRAYTVFSNFRPYWKGRLVQQLMLPLEGENKPLSSLYIEGYNFLAPLVGAFTQRIAERARELDIGKIYFFSREGFTFKRFWDRAVPIMYPCGFFPKSSYLFVSRLSLAGASCAYQGLTLTKADIAFLPAGNRDMRDVCRVYSLDIEPLIPIMKRQGIRYNDPLSPAHQGWTIELRQKFKFLIDDYDFQAEVKRQTREYNDALQRYLEKEGFFDQPDVALVDIGWMGTIQRFLYDAVKHRKDKPRFHGFLFAASRGIPYPTLPENTLEGILYDHQKFDFAASTVMYARDLFEEACRAPHASMAGYKLTNNGFRLLFRDEKDAYGKAESIQDQYFAPLQKGMLDGAAKYAAAMAVLGFTFEDVKPWLRYLMVSKLAFPRVKEVKTIKHKYHMDDFHGQHETPEAIVKAQEHLWNSSISALRWNPCIRMKYYLRKPRPG